MATKKPNDTGELQTTPKKKMKPRGGNSPVIGDNGLMLQEGDNAKYLQVNIALFNMEDIDLHDVTAVAQRLTEYFNLYAENDMKPTVAGMAMALGMNRRTLWAITHDAPTGTSGYMTALPQEVAHTIKKAYFILENLWESYMNSGKINPMAGVFLGVNNYSYQDVKRVDVAPAVQSQQDNDFDADTIRLRYLPENDSDFGNDSGSGSDSGSGTDS